MEYKPHAYQQYCIQRITDTPKLGLFLDMGLGKSVIALTAIRKMRYDTFTIRKTLVIAPKRVAEGTWMKEAQKWDHTRILRMSLIAGTQKQRIKALYTPADVYVIGRDNVTWLVDYLQHAWDFDTVIIDESSSFKSHKAKRFKALASMYPRISRCVLLTGTPSPNSLSDLWAQIYLLDAGERLEKRYTHFREKYFNADPWVRGYGGMPVKYTPKTGSEDSILERISDICISMRAQDYLDLPDIIYDEITVTLDAKARKLYNEMEKQMVLALPDDEEITAMSAAALSNKLQQLANGAVYDDLHLYHEIHDCKLDALTELMEGLRERGKSALVFYNFQHDRDRIWRRLTQEGYRIRTLDCAQDIDVWNAGLCDVLLAHPASAGYGLNLQDGGHHVVWFGLTWNYEQYVQANARLHRQGQQEKVIVHQLITDDSRDDDIKIALEKKENAQEWVLNSLKARVNRIRNASS